MSGENPGYHIGAVARMTRLDEHTIRAWERRHAAVHPGRSARGTRVYTDADVARLRLLRALTECGDPIGQIAELGDRQLRERLSKHGTWEGPMTSAASSPVCVAAVGAAWAGHGADSSTPIAGLEFVMTQTNPEAALAAQVERGADVLVCDLAALGAQPVKTVHQLLNHCRAPVAIVIYEFARQADLSALGAQGVQLVRGPLRLAQLRRVVQRVAPTAGGSELGRQHPAAPAGGALTDPPARCFSDEQLARLREISTSIDCECPNHLSSIIGSLLAFESYARTCESTSPADEALHRYLELGTGSARHQMEELLLAVCAQDGIEIE